MNRKQSAIVALLTLLTTACAPAVADESPASTTTLAPAINRSAPTTPTTLAPVTTTIDSAAAPPTTVPRSDLSYRIQPLDSALYDASEHRGGGPVPASVSIDGIDVFAAPIVPVGVEESGDMEIPDADGVGWYRFNPRPGQPGSAVLAAHISFNGKPGVFRNLAEVAVGDLVSVGYEDGSEAIFEIIERAQYDKQELPFDRVFAKEGRAILTLITCGGDFNRSLRSYEDNVVAYAVPVAASQPGTEAASA